MKKNLVSLILLISGLGLYAQDMGVLNSAKEFQRRQSESFLNPGLSPLPPEDFDEFKGLEFFPLSEKYVVEAEFVRTPFEMPFIMATTTGEEARYVKYGEAYFKIDGKQYQLNLYQDQQVSAAQEKNDRLFLPFTDATSGITTYAGGRYLDLDVPKGKAITIDFNKAYNPFCVYNPEYTCPIPPAENDLKLKVEAGMKDYK